MQKLKTLVREQEKIIFEDVEERAGFTQASNLILLDKNISDGEFRLLLILKYHGWSGQGIFPGQERLAQEIGCTRRQIIRNLQGLKEQGYITWKQRGHTKTNVYYILKKQWAKPRTEYTE